MRRTCGQTEIAEIVLSVFQSDKRKEIGGNGKRSKPEPRRNIRVYCVCRQEKRNVSTLRELDCKDQG